MRPINGTLHVPRLFAWSRQLCAGDQVLRAIGNNGGSDGFFQRQHGHRCCPYPVSFKGTVEAGGRECLVFDVTNNQEAQAYQAKFEPVTTDCFRLTIRSSADTTYSNAAQMSEIEFYL